jgi:hypothetical protein
MPGKLRSEALIASGLFAFAVVARLLVLVVWPFDGLYSQDAFAYYDYARRLWSSIGQLQAPGHFYWPLGYPVLIVLLFLFLGPTPLAGQIVSVVTGALVSPLLFLLGREISRAMAQFQTERSDERSAGALPAGLIAAVSLPGHEPYIGALLAGLVAAVSGQLFQSSILIMADAASVCWVTLGAILFARYTSTLRARYLFPASLALAWAIITRWIWGIVLLPWAIAYLVAWGRAGGTLVERLRRASWHAALASFIPVSLISIQARVVIPAALVNHHWLVGWNPLNSFERVFDNVDGHYEYALPAGLFYAQPIAHPYYLFPLLTPLTLIGLWAIRCAPLALRLIVVGWLVAAYAFLAGIPYENFRYGLTLWPPLVVLTGIGFEQMFRVPACGQFFFGVKTRLGAGLRTYALLALALISLLGMAYWNIRGLAALLARKSEHLNVTHQIAGRIPEPAILLTMGLTEYFKFYTSLRVAELYQQNAESLRELVCRSDGVYLAVDVSNIQMQWAGRAPDHNLRWLRQHAVLVELSRHGTFTLYHLKPFCDSPKL